MINCSDYDYIEIVCLFNYPIKLTLKPNQTIEGIALDTQRNEQRVECIKLRSGKTERLVVLDEIAVLEVSVENPHFKTFTFG
ncbi:Rho-binding antiterminator [uncultured Vibrio sp.]|uniref:Rho-binding antiterminator n=1 Tax=uncultured Vibrio sp. TaxID=114054 RepID=UPI0025DFB4BB|nr:Rho-binding antiterminator [uncultured Vibrio sp.]